MGEYRRRTTDQDYNNRPTYKSVDGDAFLFYNDGGHWTIGSTLGSSGWIRTRKPGLLHIPEDGWQYTDGESWHEDPLMTVSYEGIS